MDDNELPELAKAFRPGVYRHYKNHDYFVFRLVRHSETLEVLVWYQPLYDGLGQRPRPLTRPTAEEGGFMDLAREGLPRFVFVSGEMQALPEITEAQASILSASVKPGRYRHYKGGRMQVVGTAVHTEISKEDGNEFVVYLHESDEPEQEGTWWARPISSFTGMANKDGQQVPRFERTGQDE